jgi:Sigma-70 region 2
MGIDPGAVEAYEKHADDLIAYATVLVGPNEAEDVVADAVLRVFVSKSWSRVREPRRYLFRSVLNQAASHRRRRTTGRAKEWLAWEHRDGGPYVVGPAGVLSWTPIEAESAIADFVVDGEWWVAGRFSRSQSPLVQTEAGPVEAQVVESGGATWFLARLPNDVDRYVLTVGGSVTAGWRPSDTR